VIQLAGSAIEVTLDPSRGGEFIRIARPGGINALAHYDWASPVPAGVNGRYGSTQLDWLSGYRGGWQVLFPNAGEECIVDGVPVAFHGEGSIAPVRVIDQTSSSCTLLIGARLPLELTRTVRVVPGKPVVLVEETVRNVGISDVSFLWGHHPVFPLLPGSVIDAPAGESVTEESKPGPVESLVYRPDVHDGWAAIRQPAGGPPGVALAWDATVHPHLWVWALNGADGFPWYGRAHMVGIEPQRSWPFDGLAPAIERGQALTVPAGEAMSSWFTMALLSDSSPAVTRVSKEGRVSHD